MSKNDFAMQKGDPDVGDAPIREALPVEDDKRILRKVDMWYVHSFPTLDSRVSQELGA